MHYKVSVDDRYLFFNLEDASYITIHSVIKNISTFIENRANYVKFYNLK
jgi:hypothetical protein